MAQLAGNAAAAVSDPGDQTLGRFVQGLMSAHQLTMGRALVVIRRLLACTPEAFLDANLDATRFLTEVCPTNLTSE